jgi:hypothetical protein
MAINTAFMPAYSQGKSISVTTTSASTTVPQNSMSLYLLNTGSTLCYVRVGPTGTAALTTDFPVPPNIPIVIGKDVQFNTVAAITATSTATLLLIPGEGKL